MSFRFVILAGAALAAQVSLASAALAQGTGDGLPSVSVWTSYPTGTAYYTHASVIGGMMQTQHGSNIRVIPGRNDIARLTPLRTGRADYTMGGIAIYYAQEGLYSFDSTEWGPQPVRIVLTNNNMGTGLALGAAGDAGIASAADLRGKRVVWLLGNDAINLATTGFLAYAGLTWDDVVRVDVGDPGEAVDAILNGIADVMAVSNTNPFNERVMNSPRGFTYVQMPNATAEDHDRWAQAQSVVPYLSPVTVTGGAGVSAESPLHAGNYPVPILATLDAAGPRATEVEAMVRFLATNMDAFQQAVPNADGWRLEAQDLDWIIPYHPGAVAYLREAGLWSDAHQAHNDALLHRQDVLRSAWDTYLDAAVTDFSAANWREARAEALESAGLAVGLR